MAAFAVLPARIPLPSPARLKAWWNGHAYERAVVAAWWQGVDPPPRPQEVEPPPRPQAADPLPQAQGGDQTAPPPGLLERWWAQQEPLRRKLKAWWTGEELSPAPPAPVVERPAAPPPAKAPVTVAAPAEPQWEPPPPPDGWSAERTKMVQWLWGEGFDFPGGVEFILELVRPLGLRSEHSMLDIGCGVGSATRAIASSFGPWITGLESSPTLAAAGMAASEKAGLAKKAPIQTFSLTRPKLPDRRYDGIMSRLVLGAIPDHTEFLAALEKHLKPGGKLMLTEQVLVNANASSPVLDEWHAVEDHTIHPVTLEQITKDLAALKLDVRVAEDMSGALRGLVVGAWERVANDLQPGMFSAEEIDHLNREMELWHRRVGAYDAGLVKFVRVLAIKRG